MAPTALTAPLVPDDSTEYRPRHKLLMQLEFRSGDDGPAVVVQAPTAELMGEQFIDELTGPGWSPLVAPVVKVHALKSNGACLGDPSSSVAGGVRGGIVIPLCRRLRSDLTPDDLLAELPGFVLAARLAQEHDCTLAVVCSRGASVDDIPGHLREALGDRLLAFDLKDVGPSWLPVLNSRSHRVNSQRRNDVGSKRNLGLILAAVLKWDYLLFLDDDISPFDGDSCTLDAEGLSRAVATLEAVTSLNAIGWTLDAFEDNSVAGHGRREVGLAQEIFIGTGALLVRFSPTVPFFPDIYNEDWLFLIALAARAESYQTALARAGSVRQREYRPFRAARAISEEPGEVVGECLLNLLEDHGPGYLRVMSLRFWRESLGHRRQMLKRIQGRALRMAGEAEQYGDAGRQRFLHVVAGCMSVALKASMELKPEDLNSFVRAWAEDLTTFRHHLTELTQLTGPDGDPLTTTELSQALSKPAPLTAAPRELARSR